MAALSADVLHFRALSRLANLLASLPLEQIVRTLARTCENLAGVVGVEGVIAVTLAVCRFFLQIHCDRANERGCFIFCIKRNGLGNTLARAALIT